MGKQKNTTKNQNGEGGKDGGNDNAPTFLDADTIRLPPGALENLVKIDRYTVIDDKLRSIVESSPIAPPWCNAWQHSMRGRKLISKYSPEEEASPEERLAVWKAVRDSGFLPDENAGFCLIAEQIALLTDLDIGEKMAEIDRRIDDLYAEHGFEEWRSQGHDDSEDFLEFKERCPLNWDRLYFDMLRKHGEEEMAKLYRTDREDFVNRLNTGASFFCPPPQQQHECVRPPLPKWLKRLHRKVRKSECFDIQGGGQAEVLLGYAQRTDGYVEVALCLADTEIIGGPDDGATGCRPFYIYVDRLRAIFEEVETCTWEPYSMAPPLSSFSLFGSYQGHAIVLRVYSGLHDDIEPYPQPI